MLYLAIIFIIASTAYAENVIHCTDKNFDDTLASKELSLVKFYAPWCGHCKKMAPEFETAAGILLKNNPPVTLIKVDCTVETKACSKHGVSGYPTLKIFRGTEVEEYKGGRTSSEMVSTMKSKASPSSRNLDTVEAAEAFFSSQEDPLIMGYFTSDGTPLAKAHKKTADAMSTSYTFLHSTSDEVNKKYGYSDTIVLYRAKNLKNKFEDSEVKYDGDDTSSALKEWIPQTVLGLCGYRTAANVDDFKRPLVAVYYNVDYVKNAKVTNYWRNRVMKAATKLKASGVEASYSINNLEEMTNEVQEFGLRNSADKPVVGMWDKKGKKYQMLEDFSVENLENFVKDVMDGKMAEYLKSEEIPEQNTEGVKVVVAKNFDEIVNDKTKDVLIEFYAPWCGHCKSLAPKYEELATQLAGEPDIVIAKMDATANDVPSQFDVKGFPTIYFAPKNSKSSPKTYDGEREVDGFIKYLAKEATDELAGYKRNGKPKKKEL